MKSLVYGINNTTEFSNDTETKAKLQIDQLTMALAFGFSDEIILSVIQQCSNINASHTCTFGEFWGEHGFDEGSLFYSDDCLPETDLLAMAIALDRITVFQALIDKGIDINKRDQQTGRTALQYAIIRKKPEIVRSLLVNHADVFNVCSYADTNTLEDALELHASTPCRNTIVCMLVKANAKLQAVNSPYTIADVIEAVKHDSNALAHVQKWQEQNNVEKGWATSSRTTNNPISEPRSSALSNAVSASLFNRFTRPDNNPQAMSAENTPPQHTEKDESKTANLYAGSKRSYN